MPSSRLSICAFFLALMCVILLKNLFIFFATLEREKPEFLFSAALFSWINRLCEVFFLQRLIFAVFVLCCSFPYASYEHTFSKLNKSICIYSNFFKSQILLSSRNSSFSECEFTLKSMKWTTMRQLSKKRAKKSEIHFKYRRYFQGIGT